MSIKIIIEIIDLLLWFIIAANVFYVLFFALASLLPKRKHQPSSIIHHPSFLILFPAYKEDAVILHSVKTFLLQDYPKELYQVVVISDRMTDETNKQLASLPITLLQPKIEKSSKAKALQYANSYIIHQPSAIYNYVVVLDADNIVAPDFLSQLSRVANPDIAIQCHRTAKNNNNDIAALDGLSEEINNSIFRKGHNRIDMSSALIGSGMCFNYDWFKENVTRLDSAVEDRELEALLMKQVIHIHYAEDIHVLDEKISNSDNFQRQRLRWMTGQVQALIHMLPYIPKAIMNGNINYIDKTIQQALIPRSILLVIIPKFCLLTTLITYLIPHTSSIIHLPSYTLHFKWWLLLATIILALIIAIPAPLRASTQFRRVLSLPLLTWRMLQNILHIRPNNKEFIHTSHQEK